MLAIKNSPCYRSVAPNLYMASFF